MLNLFQHPSPVKVVAMTHDIQPCTYIMASGYRETLYTGVTSDIMTRIAQHRSGTFKGFTSRYGVHRLVHFEMFDTMEAAIMRENRIKAWRRQWKVNLIEASNPGWRDLACSLGFEPIGTNGSGDGS
ncbi:MAG: GIY-YIG nuclease family protein [Pseudomonadota bacterium]